LSEFTTKLVYNLPTFWMSTTQEEEAFRKREREREGHRLASRSGRDQLKLHRVWFIERLWLRLR